MKIGKLNIAAWTYDNRELANPLVILLRLVAAVPLYTGRCITFVGVLIGWGWREAVDDWKDR